MENMVSDKKDRFRGAFPQCAAMADAFRDAFGPGVKITYAEENGNTVGKALDEGRFLVISGENLIVQKPKKEEKHGR